MHAEVTTTHMHSTKTTHCICSPSFWAIAVCFASAARFSVKSGLGQRCVSASALIQVQSSSSSSPQQQASLLPFRRNSAVLARQMASSSSSSHQSPPKLQPGDALFGKFIIPADSIFYRSPTAQSLAFVNLRPIVPGHVLVIPARNICESMSELTTEEYMDLWQTVRTVQDVLRRHFGNSRETTSVSSCLAFNVAVQDGRAAGQSVPHVHVHVLPRRAGDFERNDDVYDELQEWAPRGGDDSSNKKNRPKLVVPDDGERRDRTVQEMADEAAIYRAIVEKRK